MLDDILDLLKRRDDKDEEVKAPDAVPNSPIPVKDDTPMPPMADSIAEKAMRDAGITPSPLSDAYAKEKDDDGTDAAAKAMSDVVDSTDEASRLQDLMKKASPEKEEEESPKDEALSLNNLTPVTKQQQGPDFLKALMDAQSQAKHNNAMTQIMQGAARIGAGIARVPYDKSYMEGQEALNNAPITNVINQQKMSDAMVNSQMQKRALALGQDKDDPNSLISQTYRNIISQNFPQIKTDGLSATQMEQVYPPLRAFSEAQTALQTRRDIATEKAQANQQRAGDKSDQKLDAANRDFIQKVTTMRGDKALNNQKDTIRRVDNALSIINDPRYKNPNDIPQPLVNIITKDIDAIVSGGASTEAGFKEISNPTAYGKLAQGFSFLANKPTGANAAAFVKQNQNVLQDLRDKATGAIKSKYDYLDATLGPHIRPEDRENSKNAFYQEFLNSNQPQQAPSSGPIKVRDKSSGSVKLLPAETAKKYLADPNFEAVQ